MKKKKLQIVIGIVFLLLCAGFGAVLLYYFNYESVALKKSRLYPYINRMKADTFLEKNNNPESCYQIVDGTIYLMEQGDLYKAHTGDDRMNKVISNVRSFVVIEEFIYYCTEIVGSGNSLHKCNLDGSNDKMIHKNVDACTMWGEDILLLSGHIDQWTLLRYDIKNAQFEEIEINGNASPKKTCFHDNLTVYADTYDISTVDTDSGEVKELWSLYDDYEALAEVTCLYIHNDKIYFGVKARKKKADSATGLWSMDLDGKNQEQLTKKKVNEICFVGEECIRFE